jgi:hypothetical protein
LTTSPSEELVARLRQFADFCAGGPSPFYGVVLGHMAADAAAGGVTAYLLAGWVTEPYLAVHPLRLLGAVHRRVLDGREPALAAHFPSVGGDGDADATWPPLHDLLVTDADELRGALDRLPQTNEVGRCAALVGGFLVVARDTGLPLRILEVGASAGLNLRFDCFRYEAGDAAFGDPASPVRFVDLWPDRHPPFGAGCEVVERRGCDSDPVDPTTEDGRLTLLSFVWPDQRARLDLLRGALDVAARVPAPVDRAGLLEWLPERLGEPAPGRATVVFHSTVLQYLRDDEIATLHDMLAAAGARATGDAPLAHLSLESAPEPTHAELRLTTWPGGEVRLLATATFHVGPVHWLA